jgi:hypothetical protein
MTAASEKLRTALLQTSGLADNAWIPQKTHPWRGVMIFCLPSVEPRNHQIYSESGVSGIAFAAD